jgi:hypothetical protein
VSKRFRARVPLALITVGLVAAIAASAVLAAGYGRGRFVGTAKPQFGGGKGTPITVKVKGSRVRVVEMTFSFDCASDGSIQKRTVSTPFVKVHSGPAGGGATFNGKVTPKGGGEPVDLSVSFGLRQRSVSGIADGTLDIEGLPCMKDLAFKANKK